jgi:hypothetical protein
LGGALGGAGIPSREGPRPAPAWRAHPPVQAGRQQGSEAGEALRGVGPEWPARAARGKCVCRGGGRQGPGAQLLIKQTGAWTDWAGGARLLLSLERGQPAAQRGGGGARAASDQGQECIGRRAAGRAGGRASHWSEPPTTTRALAAVEWDRRACVGRRRGASIGGGGGGAWAARPARGARQRYSKDCPGSGSCPGRQALRSHATNAAVDAARLAPRIKAVRLGA